MKTLIEERADNDNVSMNAYMIELLREALGSKTKHFPAYKGA
jgi:hypothetical protein